MEQFFILLIVGIFALAKWFLTRGEEFAESQQKKTGRPSSQPPFPSRRGATPPGGEEERMRKFFEALGVPQTTPPPRPVNPRSEIPPRPLAPVQPPPVLVPGFPRKAKVSHEQRRGAVPPPLREAKPQQIPKPAPSPPKRQPASPPELEIPKVTSAAPETGSLTVQPQTAASPSAPVPSHQTRTDIRALLRSGVGLRDAVLLREVLGPPRGLQSSVF